MSFAYAEPNRLILGVGQLWFNNVLVGALKNTVTLTMRRTFAEMKPGNMISPLTAQVVSEEAELSAEICDFKLEQIRVAMGLVTAATTAHTATGRLRKGAYLTMTGTAPQTIPDTIVSGSVLVYKLDKSVTYALTTDYTITGNTVIRVGAGTITDGQGVYVEYLTDDATSDILKFGGDLTAPTPYELRYVGTKGDGSVFQFKFHRAYVNTDFSIAFHERTSGNYTTHGFKARALADTSKAEGEQLVEIVEA